ncbi:hypothetical protein PGB90_001929 [Kerria lacca]
MVHSQLHSQLHSYYVYEFDEYNQDLSISEAKNELCTRCSNSKYRSHLME